MKFPKPSVGDTVFAVSRKSQGDALVTAVGRKYFAVEDLGGIYLHPRMKIRLEDWVEEKCNSPVKIYPSQTEWSTECEVHRNRFAVENFFRQGEAKTLSAEQLRAILEIIQ